MSKKMNSPLALVSALKRPTHNITVQENRLIITFDDGGAGVINSLRDALVQARGMKELLEEGGVMGASNWPCVKVLHPTKGDIARISYNMRVWESNGFPSKLVEIKESDDRMWMTTDQLTQRF